MNWVQNLNDGTRCRLVQKLPESVSSGQIVRLKGIQPKGRLSKAEPLIINAGPRAFGCEKLTKIVKYGKYILNVNNFNDTCFERIRAFIPFREL